MNMTWRRMVKFLYCCYHLGSYVELFSGHSKYILLNKQHIDYSNIYLSFISIVLSLEKIY